MSFHKEKGVLDTLVYSPGSKTNVLYVEKNGHIPTPSYEGKKKKKTRRTNGRHPPIIFSPWVCILRIQYMGVQTVPLPLMHVPPPSVIFSPCVFKSLYSKHYKILQSAKIVQRLIYTSTTELDTGHCTEAIADSMVREHHSGVLDATPLET